MANFPSSPSNGDFFTNDLGVIYQYVSDGNYWKIVSGALTNILTGTIANGDTTHVPHGDAVYDALALKAPKDSPTFTTQATVALDSKFYLRNANTYIQSVSDYILKLYGGDSISIDAPNVYFKNNAPVRFRNAANSADHELIKYDTSNVLQLGAEATSINANSKVIAGVANGSNANDAVNKSQLDTKVTAPASTTSAKIPAWSSTSKQLDDGYYVLVSPEDSSKSDTISIPRTDAVFSYFISKFKLRGFFANRLQRNKDYSADGYNTNAKYRIQFVSTDGNNPVYNSQFVSFSDANTKFRPLVAGYYRLTYNYMAIANSAYDHTSLGYWNGSTLVVVQTDERYSWSGSYFIHKGSIVFYANGSTDFSLIHYWSAGGDADIYNTDDAFQSAALTFEGVTP